MAQVANTRKVFQFQVEINGLNQMEAQGVTIPEVTVEAVAHGDTNYDVHTPGRLTFGEVVLRKLRPLPGSDNWAWDWLNAAQNTMTGGGALPINLKRVVVIREMDTTGTIAVNSWILEGAWVTKIGQSDFDRNSSDNIIETVTLRADRIRRI